MRVISPKQLEDAENERGLGLGTGIPSMYFRLNSKSSGEGRCASRVLDLEGDQSAFKPVVVSYLTQGRE